MQMARMHKHFIEKILKTKTQKTQEKCLIKENSMGEQRLPRSEACFPCAHPRL
jgi:hypothetical protein